MKSYSQIYIGIDLHHNQSTVGYMDNDGEYFAKDRIPITSKALQGAVVSITADHKHLTIEQGNMSFWVGEQLRDYVDRLIICDPRKNSLISQGLAKNDGLDAYHLCELLRMGSLKPVWRPKQFGDRRLFFHRIKEHLRLKKSIVANKRQLQATFRHWGYNRTLTKGDYVHPEAALAGIEPAGLARELAEKFTYIQMITRQRTQLFERIREQGQKYPEISEFQKMAGAGPITAHTFSGYLQTPHRFRDRGQLIRFCQLAVRKYSSNGRRLRAEHLSKAGHGCLKDVAYTIWNGAMKGTNEVSGFYQASLERCGDKVNARLNTERKILITLWSIWKHNRTYQPEKFFSANGDSAR